MAEESEGIEGEEGTFIRRVVRDSNFRRYYADSSTLDRIGPEFELHFLNLGVTLKEMKWKRESTQPLAVRRDQDTTDLCAVRMDSEAASNLCFNLLLSLVINGDVPLDIARANLNLIEQSAENGSSDD